MHDFSCLKDFSLESDEPLFSTGTKPSITVLFLLTKKSFRSDFLSIVVDIFLRTPPCVLRHYLNNLVRPEAFECHRTGHPRKFPVCWFHNLLKLIIYMMRTHSQVLNFLAKWLSKLVSLNACFRFNDDVFELEINETDNHVINALFS